MFSWFSNKETTAEKKPVVDGLQEVASEVQKIELLQGNELAQLSLETRIKKSIEIFGNIAPLQEESKYFYQYINENGKVSPTFTTIYSFLGWKTNQSFNHRAALAIAEVLSCHNTQQPKVMFEQLCVLKDILDEISANGKQGDTSKQLEKILTRYQIPLEKKAYQEVKNTLAEALDQLRLYVAMGNRLPGATLALNKLA